MKGNKGIIARAIEFLRNPGDWNAKNEDERNEVLRSNVWKMTIICSVMYVIEIGIFVTNIYNSIAVQRVVFAYLVVASILLPITFWVNNKYKRGLVKKYSKLGIALQVIYSTLTILFGVEIAALSREGYNTILVYYIMVTSTSAFIYMNIKMGTTMIFGTYLYFALRVLSTQHDVNIIILMLSNTLFFNIGSAVLTSLQYRNQLVNVRQDKQLKEDIDKTELLSKISTNYITIDQNNVESKMYETVKQIGEHFRAGRVKMQIRGSGKDYRNRYYWRNRKAGVSKENTVICTIEKKKKPEGKIIIEGMEKRETEAEILKYIANLIINALDKVDNEIEVSRLAYYDTLTGLANRMLYKNRLCTALQMVKRSGKQLAVMFIDLDGFKQVNDTAGHEGGDEILKTIARRLEDNVRKYDTVARFGGDEYLILLQNIENIEDVTEVANKIIPLCNEPIKYRGVNYNVSASIGIAIAPLDGDDVETLIKCADDAMYKAKEEGKNQYSFCTGEIKKDKKEEANIKTKIKTAIENGEMRIVYQPQVEIGTEKIIAMEAFVRWENNEIGNIEPNQFIPIAENTGDIRKIGKWVMEEVMKQIKKWNQEDAINIPVAVNVSLEQMKAKDYPEEVIKLKEEYGIEDGQLEIELTESKGITQNTAVIKALHQLKRNGIKITMDDFGMEYSTYNRVKRLPLDKIKIAKEMMGEMDKTAGDGALLQSLVTMAKTLNVEIIAEGIEYAKQEEMLRRANCNYAQGFYYYRPMEPEEVMEVITESNKVKVMEGV